MSAVQRRTLGVLVGSQVFGGSGLAAGIAVGSLLAADLSGSDALSGLGGTVQVLGAALAAIPIANLMHRAGRRPGLVLGYSIGALGALIVIGAGLSRQFWLLLVGCTLLGAGTAASSASRYAAADLATPEHRGRDLSLVVWATTIGSVLGPNFIGFSQPVADLLDIPKLTAPLAFAFVCFLLSSLILWSLLRPDPLQVVRDAAAVTAPLKRSTFAGVQLLRSHPVALTGVITMAIGHAVMVALMVMTPLHMDHGGASLEVIGLVISLHILGMYALSPVVGLGVDRVGARAIALLGGAIQIAAAVLASLSHEGHSVMLTVGLILLGLGWSCTLISGSTMLIDAIEPDDRPVVQGAADLVMGLAAATGGALAGVVVEEWGYALLGVLAIILCLGSASRLSLTAAR